MNSLRQVEGWVLACLQRHLRPDVLWVAKSEIQGEMVLCLRKPGTESEEGEMWALKIERSDWREERRDACR